MIDDDRGARLGGQGFRPERCAEVQRCRGAEVPGCRSAGAQKCRVRGLSQRALHTGDGDSASALPGLHSERAGVHQSGGTQPEIHELPCQAVADEIRLAVEPHHGPAA
jgi:hypothetical protein